MRKLKGSDKTYLRGMAHKLKPVLQVGKNGLSTELEEAMQEALNAHELIKIKFIDFKEHKKELSRTLAENTHAELIGLIGNIAMFYREHPDKDKRRIKLP